MGFHAVARLAQACMWLQDVVGLEATGIRRPGLAKRCYFETELFGQHLHFAVHLDGDWCFLYVAGYDQSDPPLKPLLRIADGSEGLKILCKLVRDLERSMLTEIRLPLQIGTTGMSDSWLIT